MKFRIELGIHFWMHVHTWSGLNAIDLIRLAQRVEDQLSPLGVRQIWLNDNLGYRSIMTLLGAIGARTNLKLGSAIICQYFRHPVDLADSAATIAELCEGREFSLGIAAGNRVHLDGKVKMQKPAQFLKETVQMVRALLDDQEVVFGDYPSLSEYFSMPKQGKQRLRFRPSNKNVRIFGSIHHGHQNLTHRIVAETCDGVIVGRVRRIADEGIMNAELEAFEKTRRQLGLQPAKKIVQMRSSIGDDSLQARRIGRLGNTNIFEKPEEAAKMYADRGLTVERILDIREVAERYGEEKAWEMIPDSIFEGREGISGKPSECVDKIAEFLNYAEKYGFDQVLISGGLGPDPLRAVDLWAKEILPSL